MNSTDIFRKEQQHNPIIDLQQTKIALLRAIPT